jgi:hypothetical protein
MRELSIDGLVILGAFLLGVLLAAPPASPVYDIMLYALAIPLPLLVVSIWMENQYYFNLLSLLPVGIVVALVALFFSLGTAAGIVALVSSVVGVVGTGLGQIALMGDLVDEDEDEDEADA